MICVCLLSWCVCVSNSLGWFFSVHLRELWPVSWKLAVPRSSSSSSTRPEAHWWLCGTQIKQFIHYWTNMIMWLWVKTLTHLLSLPGYICVYCTLYCLANSMKAFIGRLHFVIVAQLFPDRLASLGWLFVGFWWCSRWACVAGFLSGDTASLLDCDSRRRRAILLKT